MAVNRDAEPAGAHAFADMFFTLGAMALFAVAICAAAASGPAPAGLSLRALAGGVSYEGRMAPLETLFDDAALRERLAQARARNETVVLAIAPDGLESAFALESLLGGMRIRQSRLSSGAGGAAP